MVREVKEEIGLDVVECHLIGNFIFERKNEIMLCYHAIARGESSSRRKSRKSNATPA